MSDGAVERLAAEIGELDDMDDDLFGGFGSQSKKSKPATTVQPKAGLAKNKTAEKAKTPLSREPSLNEDPLAGLGLSDDDFDLSLNLKKKNGAKKSILPRSSSYQKGARIEPHAATGGENEENKLTSPSMDNGNPFVTSHTSVESRKKLSKQNSEEKNVNASDSDVSPRQLAVKQRRSKARRSRKGSVTPSDGDNTDLDGSLNKSSSSAQVRKSEDPLPEKKSVSKKEKDDLFDNSDGLPGMSDEDSPRKNIKTVESKNTASNALESLLGTTTAKKKSEPTMLEQIMAGKSTTVKNEEKSLGGYSPSIASSDRPTTAPHRRSVTFADQLGDDIFGTSSRPISAPEAQQGRKKKSDATSVSVDLDSDLDETTKEWLSLSKTKQERTSTEKKKPSRSVSQDDWLGLGADLTDSFKLESSGELFTPKNGERTEISEPKKTLPVKQDEKSNTKAVVETDKSALPWETSNKSAAKPPSRHLTADKTKRSESSQSELASAEKDEIPKQHKETLEGKSSKEEGEEGDEFLSLLKKSKEKRQQAKLEENADDRPEFSVNHLDLQLDTNSSLTEQPPVPRGQVRKQQSISTPAVIPQSQRNREEEEKTNVANTAAAAAADPAVLQLLSQLVQQSPQRGPLQTDSDVSSATFAGVPAAPPLDQVRALKEEVIKGLDSQHQASYFLEFLVLHYTIISSIE